MKRFLFGFLAVLFLILNTIPYLHILADDMPTDSQYEMLGAYALSSLITTGEATELDFSDYTDSDTSFLIDLGEAIFTGDYTGLVQDGLEWLGDTADSVYDSYKEYVSQWKAEHLGIMYSDWFPDERISIDYADGQALAKPLRNLFTPRGSDPIIPSPDLNYLPLLEQINKHDLVPNSQQYFWFYNSTDANGLQFYPTTNYSWVLNTGRTFYNYSYQSGGVISFPIQSIYIIKNGDTYSYTFSNTGNSPAIEFSNYNYQEYGIRKYTERWNISPTCNYSYSGTLQNCLENISYYFRNINIYVDGDPWSIVSVNTPSYPIVIPGQLTIWNNQPLEYSFPADTHIELPDLTNIIRNAINSSGVVMWSDIADTYVDINGQTAVAVTKIIRNDYDNLYMEQYPYPAMLIGMTDQTKFNEHLLDDSHAYLSPMGTVVQETVNVLPSELVGVLAIGAILTIFAVIINRLLE